MYEFDPHRNPAAMGIWGWVAPAAGVAATGYALYRARQRQQQNVSAGQIETPLQRTCRENTGASCTQAQISDLCENMSYSVITDQYPECISRITARQLYESEAERGLSAEEIGERCQFESSSRRPRDCTMYLAMMNEARGSAGAQALLAQAEQAPAQSAPLKGLGGLGFTRMVDRPVCDEVPSGQQFCFRTTTVGNNPPEQQFARNQGCLPLRSGASCETSPYGNPGNQWCCPPGWPREPGADPLRPFEFPPAPPGVMNKLTFWSQYWWFWALVVGTPVAAYLGYRVLVDEGYIKDTPYLEDAYDFEDLEVGAY